MECPYRDRPLGWQRMGKSVRYMYACDEYIYLYLNVNTCIYTLIAKYFLYTYTHIYI